MNVAPHSCFVVCVSVVSVSSYCWVLQKDQILPLLLWLQPCAIISRSQRYLVRSLLWRFGQVKRILQQSWSSEEKSSCMRMDQYPSAVLWSEVSAHRCLPGGAGPTAGSDGTFGDPSQPCDIQAECEAQLSPRKRGDAMPAVWGSSWKSHCGEMYIFISRNHLWFWLLTWFGFRHDRIKLDFRWRCIFSSFFFLIFLKLSDLKIESKHDYKVLC